MIIYRKGAKCAKKFKKSFHQRDAVKDPLRVHVCNLNLEVYVFPGIVTVQLGIAQATRFRLQT